MPGILATTDLSPPPPPPARPLRDIFPDRMNNPCGCSTENRPGPRSPDRTTDAWRDLDPFGLVVPLVDFWESEAEYHISVELPEIRESDIELAISGGTLFLFHRCFRLPEGANIDGVEAKLEDGVVTVNILKRHGMSNQEILENIHGIRWISF